MTAARGRRWLNAGLVAIGIASAVSGFLIQARYHVGGGGALRGTRLVWGFGYATWTQGHQVFSAMLLAVAAWHLWLNRKPLLLVFQRRGARRTQDRAFYLLFALAAATGLCAWGVGVILGGRHAERMIVEIHDKVAIAMSVLLALHVCRRRARLFYGLRAAPASPRAP